MEHLPDDRLQEINHVMRHNQGIWNAVWSYMIIESTFMRYGHLAGGLTRLTLKPSGLIRWALSLHTCNQFRGEWQAKQPRLTIKGPAWLLNVVTGCHATDKVNVDTSIEIGREQMAAFESGWPTRFNITLTKNVTLITSTKKSIKQDGKAVHDTELMYTR